MIPLICSVLILCMVLHRQYKKYTKAELENIPGPPSDSFLKGHFPKLYSPNGWAYHQYLWRTFGPVLRVKAMFGENFLYVYDPKALYHMFVKDSDTFQQTPNVSTAYRLISGPGLVAVSGKTHVRQRKLMNPAFSTGSIREMTPTVYSVIHKMEASVMKQLNDSNKEIDMLSWIGRTTLEVLGQCGFGHSFDDLTEDNIEHAFSVSIRNITPIGYRLAILRVFGLSWLASVAPAAVWRRLIDFIPWPALREMRGLIDILNQTSLEIYQAKKAALDDGNKEVAEQICNGKDILSILMRANMEASEEDKIPDEEVYGQISAFTLAGMDTSTNGIGRILWVLAGDEKAQRRLREEIREAQKQAGGPDLPYDTLLSLPYLDAVCRETLRMHPVLFQMLRRPTKDSVLPLSRPLKCVDGTETAEIFVPKGTNIICGIQASNRNVEVWGNDANEWKPERWLNKNPRMVTEIQTPGTYAGQMTFSAGSRGCIGYLLSQLETKAILCILISRFEFTRSQEILWRMSGIVTPVSAQSKSPEPELPLMVKFCQ